MEIISTQKFIGTSPKKLRYVVAMIKKLKPGEAVEILPHIGKSASGSLAKVIKSAIANAKVKGADVTNLVFKEIQIGEAARLKRGRPVSRGRWHPYKRRMSHIRVVLATKEPEIVKEAKGKLLETGDKEKKEIKSQNSKSQVKTKK